MGRITRDQMLMEIAQVTARRGTCSRLQVGAVVSRDGRIITTGYNGAPAGIDHCEHPQLKWNYKEENDWQVFPGRVIEIAPAEESGCTIAEHAERNAIAFAARHGLALDGSEIHTTHAPCLACSRSIINAGIVRVSYVIPYRLTEGVELLHRAGLEVIYVAS